MVALITALATSACQPGEQSAATVNGHKISAADVRADLQAEITGAKKGGGNPTGLIGAGKDTFTTDAAGSKLTTRILSELLREELVSLNITVTAADRTEGPKEACPTSNPNCLDVYPKDYKVFYREFAARYVAFNAAYLKAHPVPGPVAPTDAQLEAQARQQFDQALAQDPSIVQDQVCYVAALFADLATAEATKAKIAAGTPFVDAVNAATSAQLGKESCVGSAKAPGQLNGIAVGQLVGPIQDQSGPVLVEVVKRGNATYADYHDALIQALKQQEQQSQSSAQSNAAKQGSQAQLESLVRKAHVTVDPRYGTWDPTKLVITPPKLPQGVTTTTTTTAPAATAGSTTGGSTAGTGGATDGSTAGTPGDTAPAGASGTTGATGTTGG